MSSAALPEIATFSPEPVIKLSRPILSVVPAGSRFDLSGRVALITGASRGIGSATAEALAEQGAHVVLSSRKQADLDQEAAAINERYPDAATAIAAHAGRPERLQTLVQEVMRRFSRIDILVNNAATNPYFGPIMGAELSAWDKTFEVNLRGMFILSRLNIPRRLTSNVDRKSTRLNSSHQIISYAVFCLKKKKNNNPTRKSIQNN